MNTTIDPDDDIRDLFQQSTPTETSVDVDELLTKVDHGPFATDSSQIIPLTSWRRLMTMRNGLAAASLAACIWVVTTISGVFGPSVAFAEVKQQVAATKSVKFVESRFHEGTNDLAAHSKAVVVELEDMLKKIGQSLKSAEGEEKEELERQRNQYRQQLNKAKARITRFGTDGWKNRVMILGKFKKRVETVDAISSRVNISNMETGKSISIDHDARKVMVFTKQVTINEATGKQSETKIVANTAVDFYNDIKEVPDDAEPLPELRLINGRELTGFRLIKQHGQDTWTRTFWVDPKTKLPRHIDISYRSKNPRRGSSDWELSDIEFGIPLDESLFSTDPPKGYTVQDSKIMGIVPSNKE